jgi:5-hydroxyisourate hydrolase-like protein (transthyretin family)
MLARLLRVFVALALGMVGIGVAVAPPAAAADTVSISGSVTDTEGTAISGACVDAFWIGDDGADFTSSGNGCSDASGDYTIPGLAAGSYLLLARPATPSDWNPQWYDQADNRDDADPVDATTGATGVDFPLVAAGSISGRVTDEVTGDPIAGIYVEARGDGDGDAEFGDAFTTADGTYELTGLAPADYTVSFDARDETTYLFEYYQDAYTQSSAQPVPVASGQASTADGVLGAPGRITGTVTSGSAGVGGVLVKPYELVNGSWVDALHSEHTAPDGSYQVIGLPSGNYRVMFDGKDAGYGSEYWNDSATLADADDIVVGTGETETADADLTVLGSINGTVTSGGAQLDDVCVQAWWENTEGDWDQVAQSCDTAHYEFPGLSAGHYKLEFDPTSTSLKTEWYEDADSRDSATVITVEDGTSQTIDADIAVGSTLSGVVTSEADDAPLEGIGVTVWTPSGGGWTDVVAADTGPGGGYSFDLPAGTYKVEFRSGHGYLGEWFDNQDSLAAATPVVLPSGGGSAQADAALSQGGEITGTVTNPQGEGFLASVRAFRRNADGSYSDFTELGTNSEGYFSLSLPVGTYKLQYTGFRLADEWWDNQEAEADADPITVVAGNTYPGKDAQLDPGSTIAGHVTDASGEGLEGVTVTAYRLFGPGDAFRTFDARTDADGDFVITGLAQATYTLKYEDQEHLTEYWQDKPTLDAADFFAVPRSGAVIGKDAQLLDGGHLTGQVTLADSGNGFDEGRVHLWRHETDGWTEVGETEADRRGDYEFGGLATGQYAVNFEGRDGVVGEWWDDKPTRALADLVDVTAGASSDHIDAVLAQGTTISGTVTGPGGAPADDVTVYAYRVGSGELEQAGTDDTSGNGGYQIQGLAAGSYKLLFLDEYSSDPLAPEWWNDKLTPGLADDVTVVGTTAVSGKNAQLIAGARITGQVTDPSGPADGAEATAYRLVDGTYEEESEAEVLSNGTYEMRGLPAGTYKVKFDGGSLYDDVYYNGASSLPTATAFVVGPSETVTNIGGTFEPVVPVTAGTPTISGTPRVGSVLTANTGSWTPSGVVFTYEWRANGTPIAQATGSSLTLTAGQTNATITVAVTGTKGSRSATAVSAGVGPVAPVPPATTPVANTSAPTVAGSAKVGSTLTAGPGAWSPGGVSLAYQWLSEGAPIAGATGTSYAVPPGQVGRRLSVRVTGSLAGSPSFAAASAATAPVAPGTLSAPGKPKLAGKAKVGKTLKVRLGDLSAMGGDVSIEWFSNGKQIKGAKGKSLRLTASQEGRTITAVVTVEVAGYTPLELKTKGAKVA